MNSDLAALCSPRQQPFEYADLRGADLSGARIAHLSLKGAKLEGANLAGAVLTGVDLSYASLHGANLEGAHFEYVNATRVDLTRVTAAQSYWTVVDLSRATVRDAALPHAFLRGCTLEKAVLDGSDFSHAKIAYGNCTEASFREAMLQSTLVVGSTFLHADFTGAKKFFLSRQIVAEILRREVTDDFQRSQLVGAVELAPRWCYQQWKGWFDFNPSFREVALQIFDKYPASGCREALLEGYAGPAEGPA